MKTLRILFCAALFATLFSCGGKRPLVSTIVQQTPIGNEADGFFYYLPRTVIAVDVAVTKTTHQPGPFSQYAESLLGLQQVIKTPSVNYAISEININGFAEPDPDRFYFIEFNPQSRAQFISLSEAGIIQSVNMPVGAGENMNGISESKEFGYFGTEATFNYFIDINLQERIDTILERVRMDTITVERQTLRRSWVEKSTDVRAKEVADYILKIRDKKFDLITGYAEIAYSKEALEYMYQEMDKKENDYLALFTGISSSHTIRYRYTFTPNPGQADVPHTLFHFSSKDGVLAENIPGSIPVSILAKKIASFRVKDSLVKRIQDDRPEKKGLYYRIPDYSIIVVDEGSQTRAEARMLVNQYGVVTYLPSHEMAIEFYPNTGSIKSIGSVGVSDENMK